MNLMLEEKGNQSSHQALAREWYNALGEEDTCGAGTLIVDFGLLTRVLSVQTQ